MLLSLILKRKPINKASTSDSNEDLEVIQVNPRSGKGKEIIVNKPVVTKEIMLDKPVVNKEQKKEKTPPQELPVKPLENRKEIVLAKATTRPFSFESEVEKMKMSLPFNEICRNTEYRKQLIRILKSDVGSEFSDTVNLQDDSPTILFGPRMEPNDDDEVPPFYVTLKIYDQNLHNSMFNTGASHNLMPKEIMDALGLDITRQYKDLYSFDSRRVKCLGLIKDLVISLHQIPEKSIVMDIVVADVPAKFGMLLSRSWSSKLKGTMQMDFNYATIPIFNQQRRLWRENRLKYMISNKECPENHPIYVVDTEMGYVIFFNTFEPLESPLVMMKSKRDNREIKEEPEIGIEQKS